MADRPDDTIDPRRLPGHCTWCGQLHASGTDADVDPCPPMAALYTHDGPDARQILADAIADVRQLQIDRLNRQFDAS